jgi:hypothetical protein
VSIEAHCPRCGTPVRIEDVGGVAVAFEPRFDRGVAEVWVLHSAVRCEFAVIMAVNFELG